MQLEIVAAELSPSERDELAEMLRNVEGVENVRATVSGFLVEIIGGVAWRAIIGDNAPDTYGLAFCKHRNRDSDIWDFSYSPLLQ